MMMVHRWTGRQWTERVKHERVPSVHFADGGSGQLAAHTVETNLIKKIYSETYLSMAGIHAISGKKFESNGPSENNTALISYAWILPPFT